MLVCDPTIIKGNTVLKNFIVNEDKNAAAVFSIYIKHNSKTRDKDLGLQVLDNFICSWLAFDNLHNFMWVSINLMAFNYVSIRNTSFGISVLKSDYTVVYMEDRI